MKLRVASLPTRGTATTNRKRKNGLDRSYKDTRVDSQIVLTRYLGHGPF